jgi:hypothetical protein
MGRIALLTHLSSIGTSKAMNPGAQEKQDTSCEPGPSGRAGADEKQSQSSSFIVIIKQKHLYSSAIFYLHSHIHIPHYAVSTHLLRTYLPSTLIGSLSDHLPIPPAAL